MTNTFWQQLDNLLDNSKTVIDRPKGSAHPRYPDVIYPMDYGYLNNTSAGDGDGIDIWVGSAFDEEKLVGAVATVDLFKRDVELKLLVNCSEAEIQIIMDFYHDNQMGVHHLRREKP
jgi:inorganic pyrophosphatase